MQEPGVSKRVAVKFEDIERKVAWKTLLAICFHKSALEAKAKIDHNKLFNLLQFF
jgi:hypothetical protein